MDSTPCVDHQVRPYTPPTTPSEISTWWAIDMLVVGLGFGLSVLLTLLPCAAHSVEKLGISEGRSHTGGCRALPIEDWRTMTEKKVRIVTTHTFSTP